MNETSLANKRIAKNTMLLYFRSIVILAIGLYTSRVTLQILGVQDYGIYNLVGSVVALFSLISGAMSSACQRFITFAIGKNNLSETKKVFETSVSLHVILGIFFVIVLEILGVWLLKNKLDIPIERVQAANYVFQFSVVTTFVNVISVPYDALIIAHERMNAFAYISIVEAVMKLSAVLMLNFLSWDKLVVYGVFLLAIAVLKRVMYNVYSYKKFEEARTCRLKIDYTIFKEMFSYSGWNLMGNSATVFRNQGVEILLNMFFGVTVNAAKGICAQVQNAVFQFVTNFQTAINPQLIKSIAIKDFQRTESLIFKGSRFSFYLLIFFAVPLLVSSREILNIWLGSVPDYTVVFLWWTFIVLLEDTLNRFLINSIMAYGRIRNYQIIVAGTKLFVLPITYVFLLMGASPIIGFVVNVVLDLVCMFERLYFTNKYFSIKYTCYLKKVVFPCWLLFFISLVVPELSYSFLSKNILFAVPVSFISVTGCILFCGLDENERDYCVKYLVKRIKKERKQ